MKTYKQLVTEATKSECEKIFQEYLFGEFNKTGEMDTRTEEKIFQAIWDFMYRSSSANKRKAIPALQTLNGCKEYYKKILKPAASTLYRGLGLSLKEINSINFGGTNKDYWVGKYAYNADSKIQSWSEKREVAIRFAEYDTTHHRNKIGVLLETKVDDSFIFNGEFLNKLSTILRVGKQYEVMRIGDEPLQTTVYIDKNYYTPPNSKV